MLTIKKKLLALYTKRRVRASQVARLNVGYEQAQLMGLLYTYDNAQKHKAVLQFVDQIKLTGKKLHTLCYVANPREIYRGGFPAFTQRAIGLFGKFSDKQVIDFLYTPFDYLYHVDLVSNPILDYLLATCRAKCRVGKFDPIRASLFEMMIKFSSKEDSHQLDGLMEQMLHYTQLLQA